MNSINFEILLFLIIMYSLLINVIRVKNIDLKLNQLMLLIISVYFFNLSELTVQSFHPINEIIKYFFK